MGIAAHRSDLADVSIGGAFDSLLRAGSRNWVHNPGEFLDAFAAEPVFAGRQTAFLTTCRE